MKRFTKQIPYAVVLLISGFLYFKATRIDFVAPEGRIGPDVWPKIILGFLMLTCVYEIVKNLFVNKAGRELAGVLESIVEEAPVKEEAPPLPSFPGLLITGAAMTVAYAALINTLGFFVCTVLFLAGFTWVGRYRRPGVIAATSLIGGLVFMFVFMKIVYVSLPLGTGIFEQASIHLMRIMGIR